MSALRSPLNEPDICAGLYDKSGAVPLEAREGRWEPAMRALVAGPSDMPSVLSLRGFHRTNQADGAGGMYEGKVQDSPTLYPHLGRVEGIPARAAAQN